MAYSSMNRSTEYDILIVDDEAEFVRCLVEAIEMHDPDLRIITAPNGKHAMEMLKTFVADILITDLKMPVMDGFELLEFVQRKLPRTQVIVVSLLDSAEVRQRLAGLGVTRFLDKPLDLQLFMNQINAAKDAAASQRSS